MFMMVYYRLPGVTAVISLLIYSVLLLSLFKFIPVTLTLSGIAGFILSIGMAVDANVLIFERIREELRNGNTILKSIELGFDRAWTSIRDGNISTLITCLILFMFGTGIIQGFALTLGIGVMVSMFSAIVLTRVFLYIAAGPRMSQLKWLFLGNKK
jgi:preprotein translocase subunit SecD